MRRPFFLALAISFAALAGGLVFYQWTSLPTTLKVAVGAVGSENTRLVVALSQYLARERATVRLRLVLTDGVEGSARALEEDKADLAVVRTDVAMPVKAQTATILHRGAALKTGRRGARGRHRDRAHHDGGGRRGDARRRRRAGGLHPHQRCRCDRAAAADVREPRGGARLLRRDTPTPGRDHRDLGGQPPARGAQLARRQRRIGADAVALRGAAAACKRGAARPPHRS